MLTVRKSECILMEMKSKAHINQEIMPIYTKKILLEIN